MLQHQRQRTKRRKEFSMRYYSTKNRGKAILIAIVGVIMIIVTVWLIIAEIAEAERIKPDVEYPMVNQSIVWEGAGYSGIYAKGGEQ